LQMLMHRAGETVSRMQLLEQCWGTQETDSNLVDVYVNYLRKKIDIPGSEKLIHTVRGSGYRLGRPAPSLNTPSSAFYSQPVQENKAIRSEIESGIEPAIQLHGLRTLIHSMVHDLAQPLTSVRCFLEMMAMRKGTVPAQPAELKIVDQQADRAVALAKGISAMVRDMPAPTVSWLPLDTLIHEVLGDFAIVQQSGLLTIHQQWEPGLRVSSSPVLRQLLVMFLTKILGRNAQPLVLNIDAKTRNGRVLLEMRWRQAEPSPLVVQDTGSMLKRELESIHDIVRSLGAELVLPEGQPEISLQLPAAPMGGTVMAAVN
jgi:DNA-binding winged helix-turn-helix (wHTH) protein